MDQNLATYNSAGVVSWYEKLSELLPVEKKVFGQLAALMKNGSVLDIGVGGGRTTAYLIDKCKNYTGIDYSNAFVDSAKARFPKANIMLCDARNLEPFANATFDVANFSFNGIDYMDEEGRMDTLKEINRVLKPGGVFFFSTHNKLHSTFNLQPWLHSGLSPIVRLKTFLKLLPFYPVKLRNSKSQVISADYAIINDAAHNYSLMTFYTTPGHLRKRIQQGGFNNIAFYTRQGEVKADEHLDDWIFATCTKA